MNQINQVVQQLSEIYSSKETFPNCTFLYGQKSVGKSLCVKTFLENFPEIQSVVIHADECYHNKILFEAIINAFNKHELNEENGYEPFAKVDSMEEFLNQISLLDVSESYLIVIEKAERLRDMDMNISASLLKLQEFTGLNISTLLISHLALEKLGIDDWDVVKIHVPDYNKNDVMDILLSSFDLVHRNITKKIEKSQLSEREKEQRLGAASLMDEEFFKNFLNIFLNVFFKACRDLKELSFLAEKSYIHYYTPVLNGEIKHNDVTNLWRSVIKPLKTSLSTVYMRVGNMQDVEMREATENEEMTDIARPSSMKTFAKMLELPYYAKYLLIASFLASHNDAKSDKKLFMKHHGKERKKSQKMMSKVSSKSLPCLKLKFNFFLGVRKAQRTIRT